MVCYAVVRFDVEWGVLSERRRIGRFAAQDSALQLGIMLAFEALAAGHEVELLVQDLGGELSPYALPPRVGWTYAAVASEAAGLGEPSEPVSRARRLFGLGVGPGVDPGVDPVA